MSFWWYTRDARGKRHVWSIGTEPMICLPVVVLFAGMLTPAIMGHLMITWYLTAALLLGGLACLTVAKVSLYRQGIWISFGPGRMTRGYASLYKAAYLLLGVGVLLMALMLSVLRVRG